MNLVRGFPSCETNYFRPSPLGHYGMDVRARSVRDLDPGKDKMAGQAVLEGQAGVWHRSRLGHARAEGYKVLLEGVMAQEGAVVVAGG